MSVLAPQERRNDVEAFLVVFAALLLDNVVSLEETVGRVTDLIMVNRPDRDMIVALQSFDRLKQEFEALGDALTRYAQSTNAIAADGDARALIERDVISAITVADLKDRLLARLQDNLPAVGAPPLSDRELAEVGVDVVY